ncbi:MAG TPA: sulfatase [Planctomycetota bacterium]
MRRGASWLAAAFALLAMTGCGDREPATASGSGAAAPVLQGPLFATPPNVLMISLDTTRADRLGAYGNARGLTPNLDALAARAALFEDCMTASTLTGPSHRSLFTGQYVERHGLPGNATTGKLDYSLASLLKARGYATASFVGGGSLFRGSGLDLGFDTYWQWANLVVLEPGQKFPAPGEASAARTAKGMIKVSVDKALGWLDGTWKAEAADQPFFVFVHGYDPHCPYAPGHEARGALSSWHQDPLGLDGLCGPEQFSPLFRSGELDADGLRYVNDLYDELIVAADHEIGRLIAGLEERGLADDTLVVFSSDHGECLGEHQRVGHGRILPEETRIPLLLAFPDGRFAGRYAAPVASVDVLPTLLDALGGEAPAASQGRSLLPVLGGALPPREAGMRVVRSGRRSGALIDERWLVLVDHGEKNQVPPTLFDFPADPELEHNLAGTPEGREALGGLLARYRAWMEAAQTGVAAEQGPLDPGVAADLGALGYVEGDDGK